MASARHFRIFSREWFALHSRLAARLKGYGIPFGIGTLLAVAALSIVRLETRLDLPLATAEYFLAVPTAAGTPSADSSGGADRPDPREVHAKAVREEH